MKTLSEQISEIKAGNASKKQKQEALVKLGLTKYEVNLIIGELPKQTRERHTFTFGVEIECLMRRADLQEQAARTNLRYNYEQYNHTDNKTYYKFVSDASILGANPIECVSPVLSGKKGFDSLKNCCDTLNAAGARVNASTGLHVHIGAAALTDKAYINVFINYQMLERVIDSFMAFSRRGNNSQWCRSLNGRLFCYCATKANVSNELNGNRYFKVNPCSYERHRTIEFRQHQGTTDFEKISNWVNFCAKLVAFSKKNRITTPVSTIDDIPFLTEKEKTFFKNRAARLA